MTIQMKSSINVVKHNIMLWGCICVSIYAYINVFRCNIRSFNYKFIDAIMCDYFVYKLIKLCMLYPFMYV